MSATPGSSSGIGDLLRHYREAAGLSRDALAVRAGVSVRAQRNLERGANRPYPDTLRRLSYALGLTPPQRDALMAALSRRAVLPDAPSSSSPPVPDLSPTARAPRPAPAVSLPPIAGRTDELAAVGRYLAGEAPPVLLFAGEPGIGKSRLLVELAARAPPGGPCSRAAPIAIAARGPYAPLLAALKAHLAALSPARLGASLQGCAWLVRLLPELTLDPAARAALGPLPTWTVPPAQERRLMFEAAARFLANVAGPAGTLLPSPAAGRVGPNVGSAEPTAQSTWSEGILLPSPAHGRGVGGEGLRVAGAYRDTEVGVMDPLAVLLADLGRESRLTRLPLAPLAAPEARAVLTALVLLGRFREALLVLEAALPRLEAAGDLALLGWTLISVSVARYTLGEFDRAGRSIARASEPAARVGDPVLATFVAFWRGMVLFAAGAWAEARAWMERARRAAGPVAASWALPYPAYGLGHLSLVEGRPAAAHASLQQAIAVAAQTGDSQPLCFVHAALAEHDLLEGRPDAARARLQPLLDRTG